MNELFKESVFFGCALSLVCYWIGTRIAKKFPLTICNPLLIASILVMLVLAAGSVSYTVYNQSAEKLTWLLTPATVSLAVPMYREVQLLKKNLAAILISLFSGCVAGMLTIWALCRGFGVAEEVYCTLLPKSITTAIAMGVSEEIGGVPSVTVGMVVFTGLLGAVIAKSVFRLLKIHHPVAVGLACGNAAHAIGTSKALECGDVEGAMSSLAIVVAGVFTVVLAPLFAMLFNSLGL